MPRTSTASSRTPRRTATKAPARRSARSRKTDVLSMLEDDHKRVLKLFRQFDKADRDDAEALRGIAEQACNDLTLHAQLEEEIFYPALREAVDAQDDVEMLEEARVEHDTAKQLIEDLRGLEAGDARYAATFTVLGEYVKHHVEEEEKEIFRRAKRARLDVEALGEQMQERREQLQQGRGQDAARGAEGGSGRAPREVPVKEMDIEDEADMEPAQPRSERPARGARGVR